MLELNEVLLEGEERTLSMMAGEGRMTCLTRGTPRRRTRWLHALMGFEPLLTGFLCLDGEPLTPATLACFRSQMSFAPARMVTLGQVVRYEPPTVQDVFALRANRDRPISNGLLAEEARRTGAQGEAARWLAVSVLRDRPILLVDTPPAATARYLQAQAAAGRTVVVATTEPAILDVADTVVEI